MKFSILLLGSALLGLVASNTIVVVVTDPSQVVGIVSDLTGNTDIVVDDSENANTENPFEGVVHLTTEENRGGAKRAGQKPPKVRK
jgi:hypothetical protein